MPLPPGVPPVGQPPSFTELGIIFMLTAASSISQQLAAGNKVPVRSVIYVALHVGFCGVIAAVFFAYYWKGPFVVLAAAAMLIGVGGMEFINVIKQSFIRILPNAIDNLSSFIAAIRIALNQTGTNGSATKQPTPSTIKVDPPK